MSAPVMTRTVTETATPLDVEALYREKRSQVFWSAWRRTQNWHDAEDIAQDAFLKAFEQRDQYRADAPPSTWVLSIAKWQAIALISNRSRYVAAGEWVERFVDEQPLPEENEPCGPCMGDPEVQERVRQALAAMPPAVRTAIDLYCVQGLPVVEVAERMGINRHAVHELVYRAFNEVDLNGPEWRDPYTDSPEAEAFRANAVLLRVLPPKQREAVRLRYMERLTVAEVAARMGTTVRAVSNNINKARTTVRTLSAALQPVGAR